MDCESSGETSSTSSNDTRETVNFDHVTTVATRWMLDFMFVSLCRSFKEGKLEDFNETLSAFQAVSQSSSLKGNLHDDKILICAFLARVMHGKELDVQFEEDESVMPLMSALEISPKLKHIVVNESLLKKITLLLGVQSVAVCLEEGQRSSASSALKWLEKHKFPQNMRVKLSTIVTKGETHHPFLTSFSFSSLLEATQSFLDTYLEKHPSDYLLKAATEMVQSSKNFEDLRDVMSDGTSVTESPNKSKPTTQKTKRTLLSTKSSDLWRPDPGTPCVSLRRLSNTELSEMTSRKSLETAGVPKTRKVPRKWTWQEDKYLKEGVKRHGHGKWSKILLDYDFDGRTGTMLKDRWRVLKRTHKVS